MLYVIHGDAILGRQKARQLVTTLRTRRPDATYFLADNETTTEGMLEEYIVSRGLFEANHIVLCDHLFENEALKESFLKQLSDIHDSKHIFIVLETTLTAPVLKKLEKHAEKIQEVKSLPQKTTSKGQPFNVFSITDALCARNTERTWALYRQAIMQGIPPEEIHGMVWWQIKTLGSVEKAKNIKNLKLKPFVETKAKRALSKFSSDELADLEQALVETYHEARRGEGDLETGLEMLILERV